MKNSHVGLVRQLQEVKCILDDDETPTDYLPQFGQDPPERNNPETVLFSGLGIKSAMPEKQNFSATYTHHQSILHSI